MSLDDRAVRVHLTVDETKKMFAPAASTRNGSRFVIALALGLRQGEVLGLQWDDVDFGNQVLTVRRARVCPRYEHACDGACGHKYAVLPATTSDEATTGTPKSLVGRRAVGLPDPLIALLRVHKARQASEESAPANCGMRAARSSATSSGA